MPVLETSIVINAPVEKVFAIEDDPKRLPEYLPGIVEIAESGGHLSVHRGATPRRGQGGGSEGRPWGCSPG